MVDTVLTFGSDVGGVEGKSSKCPTAACCRTYKQGDKCDGKASKLLIKRDGRPSKLSQRAVDPEALTDILIDGPIQLIHLSCKTGLAGPDGHELFENRDRMRGLARDNAKAVER